LEGKVQLKNFCKKQSMKYTLCTQFNNGAVFVPSPKTSFAKSRENHPAFLVGLKMAAF
jgi:hypothetical protein